MRGGRDARVRLRDADLLADVLVGRMRGRRNMHARNDPPLRKLRHTGVHLGLRVGSVRRPGRLRGGRHAAGLVRRVLAADLRDELSVGRLRASSGQRVRLPQRHQHPRVQRVCVRPSVVPQHVPVEHGVYVVLHHLRRLSVGRHAAHSPAPIETLKPCASPMSRNTSSAVLASSSARSPRSALTDSAVTLA